MVPGVSTSTSLEGNPDESDVVAWLGGYYYYYYYYDSIA